MKIDPTCKKCEKKCKQRHPAVVVSCAKFIPAISLGRLDYTTRLKPVKI